MGHIEKWKAAGHLPNEPAGHLPNELVRMDGKPGSGGLGKETNVVKDLKDLEVVKSSDCQHFRCLCA